MWARSRVRRCRRARRKCGRAGESRRAPRPRGVPADPGRREILGRVMSARPVMCAIEDSEASRHAVRAAAWLARALDSCARARARVRPDGHRARPREEMLARGITDDDLEHAARRAARRLLDDAAGSRDRRRGRDRARRRTGRGRAAASGGRALGGAARRRHRGTRRARSGAGRQRVGHARGGCALPAGRGAARSGARGAGAGRGRLRRVARTACAPPGTPRRWRRGWVASSCWCT